MGDYLNVCMSDNNFLNTKEENQAGLYPNWLYDGKQQ
jgi:hypothetical protein